VGSPFGNEGRVRASIPCFYLLVNILLLKRSGLADTFTVTIIMRNGHNACLLNSHLLLHMQMSTQATERMRVVFRKSPLVNFEVAAVEQFDRRGKLRKLLERKRFGFQFTMSMSRYMKSNVYYDKLQKVTNI